MTEDRDSWFELLPIHDTDATIWEVVVDDVAAAASGKPGASGLTAVPSSA
jgi:hypothetical protein